MDDVNVLLVEFQVNERVVKLNFTHVVGYGSVLWDVCGWCLFSILRSTVVRVIFALGRLV